MSQREEEMADIMIVIADDRGVALDAAIAQLTAMGIAVADLNEEEWVIEASVEAGKVAEIRKLPFVECVRLLFDYISEHPGEADEESEEDAL